jgi:hypothetical protein
MVRLEIKEIDTAVADVRLGLGLSDPLRNSILVATDGAQPPKMRRGLTGLTLGLRCEAGKPLG